MGLQKKRLLPAVLLGLLLLLLLSGCGGEEEKVQEILPEDDGISIGICFDSFLIERWERDRDVFVSTAKEAGAEVNVQNANGDVETQIEQIRYLIDKDMDAIVIVGVDSTRLKEVVEEAHAKGIVVVAYDRMLRDAGPDLYVSFDNRRVGELMAEAFVKTGGVETVFMLSGPTEDNNVLDVNEGFQDVCAQNGIAISDIFYTQGWRPENAYDFLAQHPSIPDEVDALMCGNDSIATSVVRYLAERRRAGQIPVTGQDADLEACQRIVQGTQLTTIYKPVEKEARAAARATIALIKGEKIKDLTGTKSDGSSDIPSIILTPLAVTRENIDSIIIDSGFHSRDEVYLYAKEENR